MEKAITVAMPPIIRFQRGEGGEEKLVTELNYSEQATIGVMETYIISPHFRKYPPSLQNTGIGIHHIQTTVRHTPGICGRYLLVKNGNVASPTYKSNEISDGKGMHPIIG